MEIFNIKTEGYHPFVINDGWQVAQLNYIPKWDMENIDKMEKHSETDEIFILLHGNAVLVEGEYDKGWQFKFYNMEERKTYNVLAGSWHNIVLFRNAEIVIVEKNNTHINDCHYKYFEKKDKELFVRSYHSHFDI